MAKQQRYFDRSEVAMLVLGYLKENNLTKTLTTFLHESKDKDLSLYWQNLLSGKNVDLNICGYDLTTILEEFAASKLTYAAEGKTIFLPGEEKSIMLSQLEINDCLDVVEQEKLRKEQQRMKNRIRNQAYKERRRELRDLRRFSVVTGTARSVGVDVTQKLETEECDIQTNLENDGVLRTQHANAESEAVDSGAADILRQAVSESGIGEETRDGSQLSQKNNCNTGTSSGSADRGSVPSKDEEIDLDFLDQIMEQTHLPERLAAYINKELEADGKEKSERRRENGTQREKCGRLSYKTSDSTMKSMTKVGVICSRDLQCCSEEELSGVTHARRIKMRRSEDKIETDTVLQAFDSLKPPSRIRAKYLSLDVRPYVPLSMRFYKCQSYGNAKCRCKKLAAVCVRCGKGGHVLHDYSADPHCVNWRGDHAASSKTCPKFLEEQAIVCYKAENGRTFQQALKAVVVDIHKTISTETYASAVKTHL
ncbi:nucleic-acid-binding protein from mobile element jockey [Plakobranchus ocellatus]|uniref:Nucleic-acid-binding protein from mobile element jockey n=1 Tax=Plakobranchus ocellatus TaxID=259542 RepID=A0AAV3YCN8_9GAST|nr:nucleic-acid-binding protein from mobile element jockey [Plakobranchus ocellatus]